MHVDSIPHNDLRDDPAPLCKADVDWTPCSHVQLSSDGKAIGLCSCLRQALSAAQDSDRIVRG